MYEHSLVLMNFRPKFTLRIGLLLTTSSAPSLSDCSFLVQTSVDLLRLGPTSAKFLHIAGQSHFQSPFVNSQTLVPASIVESFRPEAGYNGWEIVPLKNLLGHYRGKFFLKGYNDGPIYPLKNYLGHYRGISLLGRVYWTSNNGSKTIIEAFRGHYSIISCYSSQERFSHDRS